MRIIMLANLSAVLLIFFFVHFTEQSKLAEVTETNWERLLSADEWMVEFYAPWCPACNRFESVWKEFSEKSDELGIRVGSADVNANPVLSGLFSVTSLPTVYHIKDGQYRVFDDKRDLNSLVEFIQNKKWEKIRPSSSWLTPNSFLIKMLSLLFKATLYFKDLYTHLNEAYGLPTWAVLGIFVLITIGLGLGLGIALIVSIDCIFPPKHQNSDDQDQLMANQDVIADDGDDEKKDENEEKSGKDSTGPAGTVKRRAKAKKDY